MEMYCISVNNINVDVYLHHEEDGVGLPKAARS